MVGDIVLERMRYGGVTRQVLGVEAQRDVAPFDVGVDVGPQGILRPGRRGRLEERTVGLVDVEAPKPLEPRVVMTGMAGSPSIVKVSRP